MTRDERIRELATKALALQGTKRGEDGEWLEKTAMEDALQAIVALLDEPTA